MYSFCKFALIIPFYSIPGPVQIIGYLWQHLSTSWQIRTRNGMFLLCKVDQQSQILMLSSSLNEEKPPLPSII